MNQYSEITYQKQLKLCTYYVKVDVQSILLNKDWSSRKLSRAQALLQDFMIWAQTQQELVRIKENFENRKYGLTLVELTIKNFLSLE